MKLNFLDLEMESKFKVNASLIAFVLKVSRAKHFLFWTTQNVVLAPSVIQIFTLKWKIRSSNTGRREEGYKKREEKRKKYLQSKFRKKKYEERDNLFDAAKGSNKITEKIQSFPFLDRILLLLLLQHCIASNTNKLKNRLSAKHKFERRNGFERNSSGVNFINVQRAAFTLKDPKSEKSCFTWQSFLRF